MPYLTEHFTLDELTGRGSHLGVPNSPPVGWINRLRDVANVLEAARSILGVPLHVTYGYRSPALNKACGGSETSDHMNALAADFIPVGMEREAAFRKLWDDPYFMVNVDQLILERGCIHVGIGARKRKQGRGDRPYPLLAVWPFKLPEVVA